MMMRCLKNNSSASSISYYSNFVLIDKMLKTNSSIKWKCPNCFLRNEFNSIKSYTNHMRVCTAHKSETNFAYKKIEHHHHFDYRNVIEDDDVSSSAFYSTKPK